MRTIVAQVCVKKDDKYLMVQENKDGIKGKWNMPAGKLEDGESIIDAAIRETKEEANIDVNITGLIGIQESITSFGQLIILYFSSEYVSGKIEYDEKEISMVKWMSEEEIMSLNKKQIRGGETIEKVLTLSKEEAISLDRLMIENFLNN